MTTILTTSHLVRLSFFHLEPDFFVFLITRHINPHGVSILLGCPQSLSWDGARVARGGRVTPSALSQPRSKCRVPLTRFTSQDPSKDKGFMHTRLRSTMHEVRNHRSITERWRTRSRATRLRPENQGYYLLRRLRNGGVLLYAK